MTIPPSNPSPSGRPRSELARLIENWFERSESAAETRLPIDLASAFGFLRRTDPALLRTDAWERLRDRVERAVLAAMDSPEWAAALGQQLPQARARIARELAEFASRAEIRERAGTDAASTVEERMDAIRIAEALDAALLAASLSLRNELAHAREVRAAEGLAHDAAKAAEAFASIEGWFRAMDRSVDRGFRPTRFYWRGDGMRPDDKVLLVSAAWIQSTHARIRAHRIEQRELAAERRDRLSFERIRLRLERLERGADGNEERWRALQDDLDRAAGPLGRASRGTLGLLAALGGGAMPRIAAASTSRRPAPPTSLEWHDAASERIARCAFDARIGASELVIEFFDAAGSIDRSLDGLSAAWLGAVTTITDGRARFAGSALRAASSPLETLARGRALFIGGVPWLADFEQDPEE